MASGYWKFSTLQAELQKVYYLHLCSTALAGLPKLAAPSTMLLPCPSGLSWDSMIFENLRCVRALAL
jgi:hypothetical protein